MRRPACLRRRRGRGIAREARRRRRTRCGSRFVDAVALAVLARVVDDLDDVGAERAVGAVDARDPVVHPPVTELGRVVRALEDVHVLSMREVVREDLPVALAAGRTDGADVVHGREGADEAARGAAVDDRKKKGFVGRAGARLLGPSRRELGVVVDSVDVVGLGLVVGVARDGREDGPGLLDFVVDDGEVELGLDVRRLEDLLDLQEETLLGAASSFPTQKKGEGGAPVDAR